jgi:hypothetical protein
MADPERYGWVAFGSALALIACLAASPVTARQAVHYLSGEGLYELCSSSIPAQRGECLGYLEGIVDAGDNELPGSICVPPGVKSDELRDVVVTYLRDRAATDRHVLPADFLVRTALASFCGSKPMQK